MGEGQEQHWDRLVRRYGLEKAFIWFVGNITAYVERYRDKNGVEDLLKARHYLDKLIELEEAAEATSKGEREKARKASNQPTKEKEEAK